MKFGNIKAGNLDVTQRKDVIKDHLEKSMITQAQYNYELRKIKRDQLLYIALTNGAYTAKKANARNLNLTEHRKKMENEELSRQIFQKEAVTEEAESEVTEVSSSIEQ